MVAPEYERKGWQRHGISSGCRWLWRRPRLGHPIEVAGSSEVLTPRWCPGLEPQRAIHNIPRHKNWFTDECFEKYTFGDDRHSCRSCANQTHRIHQSRNADVGDIRETPAPKMSRLRQTQGMARPVRLRRSRSASPAGLVNLTNRRSPLSKLHPPNRAAKASP